MRQITKNLAKSERDKPATTLEEDIVFGRLKPRKRLVEKDIMNRLETQSRVERRQTGDRWCATCRNAAPTSCNSFVNCFIARQPGQRRLCRPN